MLQYRPEISACVSRLYELDSPVLHVNMGLCIQSASLYISIMDAYRSSRLPMTYSCHLCRYCFSARPCLSGVGEVLSRNLCVSGRSEIDSFAPSRPF